MYTEEFDILWEKYPRKVAKYKAFLSFRKLSKKEKIALNNWLDEYIKKWKTENIDLLFIPHLGTFINQKRYYDEIIVDTEKAKKINTTLQKKREEKKEEKLNIEEEKNLKEIYKKISDVQKQIWRYNVKIEILVKFPKIWKKEKIKKFYYVARINFLIKRYINESVNT